MAELSLDRKLFRATSAVEACVGVGAFVPVLPASSCVDADDADDKGVESGVAVLDVKFVACMLC